jgi:hypothetical protein
MKGTPSIYYESTLLAELFDNYYFACADNFCGYRGMFSIGQFPCLKMKLNNDNTVTTAHISKYPGLYETDYPRKSYAEPRGKSYHRHKSTLNNLCSIAMTGSFGLSAVFTNLLKGLVAGVGLQKTVYDLMFVQCQRCELIFAIEGFYKHACQLQMSGFRNPLHGEDHQWDDDSDNVELGSDTPMADEY